MRPTVRDRRTPWTWTPAISVNHKAARFLMMSSSKLIGWRIEMSGWEESGFSVVLRTCIQYLISIMFLSTWSSSCVNDQSRNYWCVQGNMNSKTLQFLHLNTWAVCCLQRELEVFLPWWRCCDVTILNQYDSSLYSLFTKFCHLFCHPHPQSDRLRVKRQKHAMQQQSLARISASQ